MEDEHNSRAEEIRAIAKNFLAAADATALPDYRNKLLETAARLVDAANAMDIGPGAGMPCA
jgi:hypothetical protein